MTVRAHVLLSGIVQGVGFRYFVYDRAVNLNIAGFVRNLRTGQVEIEAEGDRSLIETFLKEVKVGPRSSHITRMDLQWIECTNSNSEFEIR